MMIREYTPADVPAMRALWRRVFHESEVFLDAFFRLLPDIGSAVAALGESGELLGAAIQSRSAHRPRRAARLSLCRCRG